MGQTCLDVADVVDQQLPESTYAEKPAQSAAGQLVASHTMVLVHALGRAHVLLLLFCHPLSGSTANMRQDGQHLRSIACSHQPNVS